MFDLLERQNNFLAFLKLFKAEASFKNFNNSFKAKKIVFKNVCAVSFYKKMSIRIPF